MKSLTTISELYQLIQAYGNERFIAGKGLPNESTEKFHKIHSYVENQQSSPVELPAEIVELIEHCGRDVSDADLPRLLVWASKLNLMASGVAQAHLPQKHRCVRAGCDGVPDTVYRDTWHAIECPECSLTGKTCIDIKTAWQAWYLNESGEPQ